MERDAFIDLIHEKITIAETINILPHVSADGDAYGACVAFSLYLQGLGKKVRLVAEEIYPDIYQFICERDFFEVFDENKDYAADLNIAMDTGDMSRLGKRKTFFFQAESVNIDHHKTNSSFADFNFIDVAASSTGEIVYEILSRSGAIIDKDIATCIYVAIATDTGGFRYQNTTIRSFEIASDLVKKGIEISDISRRIFESITLDKTKLMCIAINNLSLHKKGHLAMISLRKEHFESLSITEDMFEGLVNIARNIKNVKVAALVRENGANEIKVNLRSNDDIYDVAKVAQEYKGGGHGRAAGFIVRSQDYHKFVKKLKKRLGELID
ncbi:MAG: bifunctional oligoribonuclease/PAP phosphatase NrnA [Clostridia bacterium]